MKLFKIDKLTLYNNNEESYTYDFSYGINYFIGENDTGKTVFYNFINYMFGSSNKLTNSDAYYDLKRAHMILTSDGASYEFGREVNSNLCYFRNIIDKDFEEIDLREYKRNLNQIFSPDDDNIDLHKFSGERITYRSFTAFNFISEDRHGVLVDFLSEALETKNRFRLPIILDFIFNENINEIELMQRELDRLEKEIKLIEQKLVYQDLIVDKVNENLRVLDITPNFNGMNHNSIRKQIRNLQELNVNQENDPTTLTQLLIMYNTMTEQIKKSESIRSELKVSRRNNENRIKMIATLEDLIDVDNSYEYLVEPVVSILNELNKTISFRDYYISNDSVKLLKKDRDEIKKKILNKQAKEHHFTVDDKTKAILLIKEHLEDFKFINTDELEALEKKVKELRRDIQLLKRSDDFKKVKEFSNKITEYFLSASEVSEIVAENKRQNGFWIDYIKKGNILQPMLTINDSEESEEYIIGSMARKTLIQLSGYLAFFYLFLKENKYPVIPLLVIDHISKPFDAGNSGAIGAILSKAMTEIGKEELQVVIFSDRSPQEINISPNNSKKLVTNYKSGFNPFINKIDSQK